MNENSFDALSGPRSRVTLAAIATKFLFVFLPFVSYRSGASTAEKWTQLASVLVYGEISPSRGRIPQIYRPYKLLVFLCERITSTIRCPFIPDVCTSVHPYLNACKFTQ